MAHCNNCGTQITEGSGFCQSCGQQQPASAPPPAPQAPASGLSQNTAGLLCYLLGWVTGVIFLLIDKRPYVRFHAAQSIVVFGGLNVLRVAVGLMFGAGVGLGGGASGGNWGLISAGIAVMSLLGIITLIAWILLMVKAHQGEQFQVPGIEGIVQSIAGSKM